MAASVLPAARIAAVSATLLGRPYRVDPLGEGAGALIDDDPLWRTDAFDCLTFVGTTLALARSVDAAGAPASLQRLRYAGGVIDFAHRNHFPAADWIPNNVRGGAVIDISARIAATLGAPRLLTHARGVVHRAQWLAALPRNPNQARNGRLRTTDVAQRNALQALIAGSTDQAVDVVYLRLRELPARQLQQVIAAVPDGAIVFIVRPNTSLLGPVGAVTQLSHVGFVLRDAHGTAQYRNASSGRALRVIDTPLLAYLQRMQHTRSFAGMVVLQALADDPAASLLWASQQSADAVQRVQIP